MEDENVEVVAKLLINSAFHSLEEWKDNYGIDSCDPKTIYHYSTLDSCSKIIKSRDLYLFHSNYTNDKNEYKSGREILETFMNDRVCFIEGDFRDEDIQYEHYHIYDEKKFDNLLNKTKEEFYKFNSDWFCYIGCFSLPRYQGGYLSSKTFEEMKENDCLSMWRGYGMEGSGGCIGVEYSTLEKEIENKNNLILSKVIYNDHEKYFFMRTLFREVYELYEDIEHKMGLRSSLAAMIHYKNISYNKSFLYKVLAYALSILPTFFKHPGFCSENEIRIIGLSHTYQNIDTRVNFIGKGHDSRPFIKLSFFIDDKFLLPVNRLTLGPQVIDKEFHKYIFKSGCFHYCEGEKICIDKSMLPYRGRM